jgi:hypothetical protein
VGSAAETIRWSFDRLLQQPRSPGGSYLAGIAPVRLEELVEQWWKSLPSEPNEARTNAALRFTNWVRTKQQQRKNLVHKLLATDGNNRTHLLPSTEVLIADPYAERRRRVWFPHAVTVSAQYLSADAESSASDWRPFFESLSPAPQGRFSLALIASSHTTSSLHKLMGDDYTPPSLRSSFKSVTWRGVALSSNEYKVLDANLPQPIQQRFAQSTPLTNEESRAFAAWVAESPGMLKEYSDCKLAYIPPGWRSEDETSLPRAASWRTTLQNTAWVFAANGAGPFCPADVLDRADPARPDAPVADLPSELLRFLTDAGIQFGARLPDAPAIIRLRVQGPTAPIADLLEFLRNAIQEGSGDAEKQRLLIDTLRNTPVFPLPPGRESPDRLTRVPLDRVVRSERGRSNFGAWLATADSFADDSVEGQLFALVCNTAEIPGNTTGQQALTFLDWVWKAKPDADRVRSLLPRAYQYVREDWQSDALADRFDHLRSSCVIFTQNKRRWLAVTDSSVFFNDLPEGVHLPDEVEVSFATPGHLGDSRVDQIAVAQLLGLKLLSTRFKVDTQRSNVIDTPETWQQAFTQVQRELLARLSESGSDDSDEESTIQKQIYRLTRCEHIATVIYDNGLEVSRSPRNAAIVDGLIAVKGQPGDFADAICTILFSEWGLRRRRDLVDLIPKVAIQLSQIGDEQLWSPPSPSAEYDEADETSNLDENDRPLSPSGDANRDKLGDVDDSRGTPVTTPAGTTRADGFSNAPSTGAVTKSRTPDSGADKPSDAKTGRGHTASDREGIIKSMMQRRDQLDKQIQEATSTGVIPNGIDDVPDRPKRSFQSDQRYRDAVVQHESRCGRIP